MRHLGTDGLTASVLVSRRQLRSPFLPLTFLIEQPTTPRSLEGDVEMDCSLNGTDEVAADYGFTRSNTSGTIEKTVVIRLEVDANNNIEMVTTGRNLPSVKEAARYLVADVLYPD